MKFQQMAADTRDPVATAVFTLLGVAGALGWIPEDTDPNTIAEVVGLLMGATAGIFSWVHHRSFKQALRAGLEAQARAGAPAHVEPDRTTPIDGLPGEPVAPPPPSTDG